MTYQITAFAIRVGMLSCAVLRNSSLDITRLLLAATAMAFLTAAEAAPARPAFVAWVLTALAAVAGFLAWPPLGVYCLLTALLPMILGRLPDALTRPLFVSLIYGLIHGALGFLALYYSIPDPRLQELFTDRPLIYAAIFMMLSVFPRLSGSPASFEPLRPGSKTARFLYLSFYVVPVVVWVILEFTFGRTLFALITAISCVALCITFFIPGLQRPSVRWPVPVALGVFSFSLAASAFLSL